MKKSTLLSFIFIFATFAQLNLFSQSNPFVTELWGLIQDDNYDETQRIIDSVLNDNPNDIDALMMKGNAIIRKHWAEYYGDAEVAVNNDESIYDNTMGFIQEPVRYTSKEVVDQVEPLWLKCIELDKTRDDIQFGLCYLYATALMKEPLIKRMKVLKDLKKGEQNFQFTLTDYAQEFFQRGEFEGAVAVYQAIISLYPNESGLYNDLAAIHFMKGYIDKALKYFAEAATKENFDELTYSNIVLIYSVAGHYDKALEFFKKFSAIVENDAWILYDALLMYNNDKKGWKKKIEEYLFKTPKDSTNDARKYAEFLVSEENKDDYASYVKSLDLVIPTPYVFLIHHRACRLFKDKFEPLFNFADYMSYYNNYKVARRVFEELLSHDFNLRDQQQEDVNFYYAWVLYKSDEIDKAFPLWKSLLKSEDFFRKSAGAYFAGKYLKEKGKDKEAMEMFKTVSDRASESKYATWCWNFVIRENKE